MNLNPTQFDWYKKMTGDSHKDSGLVEGTAAYEAAAQNNQAKAAAEEFMAKHPDYYKSPGNATMLTDWMQAHGAGPTLKGFEMAYAATKDDLEKNPTANHYNDYLKLSDVAKIAMDVDDYGPVAALEAPAVPNAVWDMLEAQANNTDSIATSAAINVSPTLSELVSLNAQQANSPMGLGGALGGIAGAIGGAISGAGLSSGISSGTAMDQMNNQLNAKLVQQAMQQPGIDAHKMWEKKIKELEDQIAEDEKNMLPANQIAYKKAELNAKKQSYLKTQIEVAQKANDPKSTIGSTVSYYNKKFIENLKGQTTLVGAGSFLSPAPSKPAPEPVFDNTSVVQAEQKFLQRIGMASNCNVSVQSKVLGTWPKRTLYRLLCDQCSASVPVNDSIIITTQQHNHPIIAEFCKAHRHDSEAPACAVTEGRKFRDDE